MSDLFERIVPLRESGLTFREIADYLEISYDTVYGTWRRESKKLGNPELDKAREDRDKRLESARQRAEVKHALFVDDMKTAIKSVPILRTEVVSPSHETSDRSAVLLLSDIHLGQYTTSRLNAGWEQSSIVCRMQFKSLVDQLLAVQSTLQASELVILDLGDNVEGDNLRPSQHRMVDQLVVQQTAEYGRLLADLIVSALTVFPRVRVERVPGNHGRTTQKASYGGLAELDPIDSFDWLGGEFAREILRPDIARGTVVFNNHSTYFADTYIRGKRVIFEHGSSVKAPGQFMSPMMAVEKTAHAYRELLGPFDLFCLGHYHRAYQIPFGYDGLIIGNGSFPPTSPFVVTALHQASIPVQLLFTMTDDGVKEIKRLVLPVEKHVTQSR